MTVHADTNRRKFLLTEGGPTYRLEMRVGLIRANAPRILRRAILSILVTWIPLLILSALQGYAAGHLVPVPFLRDFAVHARFLLAVPMLLLAETVLGPRLAHAATHFVDSGLIVNEDFAKFSSAVDSGLRWRDSTTGRSNPHLCRIYLHDPWFINDSDPRFHLVRSKDELRPVIDLGRMVVRAVLRSTISVSDPAVVLALILMGSISMAHEQAQFTTCPDTP
jgi:hypothetical protein